jgi:hypothetical protein
VILEDCGSCKLQSKQRYTTTNFFFFFLVLFLFIYSYVHTLLGPFLPSTPLASRQNLFCPFLQFCWRVDISNTKKDKALTTTNFCGCKLNLDFSVSMKLWTWIFCGVDNTHGIATIINYKCWDFYFSFLCLEVPKISIKMGFRHPKDINHSLSEVFVLLF